MSFIRSEIVISCEKIFNAFMKEYKYYSIMSLFLIHLITRNILKQTTFNFIKI